MAENINEMWIEDCYVNFKEYLTQKSYDMAESAIEDARENGFTKEAEIMQKDYENHRRDNLL